MKLARAITLKQMSTNIQDIIHLCYKYRDYKTAFEIVDQLYYRHL
jgi:hypothetical protein